VSNNPIGNREAWKKAEAQTFWKEIAPSQHVLQLYQSEKILLDTLAGFVGSGINSGECVTVIATPAHLNALDIKLYNHGIKVEILIADHRYIRLEASTLLSKFMVQGMPDEHLFHRTINGVLRHAVQRNRRLRVFGEMASLLWAEGNIAGTVMLEELWDSFGKEEGCTMFCAYPAAGFALKDEEMTPAMRYILDCHSRRISGTSAHLRDVVYQ